MTRWHAVSPTREVLGTVAAEDIGEARTMLRATLAAVNGSYVQSAVAFACGITVLRDGAAERKRGKDFRVRAGMPKRIWTGRESQVIRESNIRRGVERRSTRKEA